MTGRNVFGFRGDAVMKVNRGVSVKLTGCAFVSSVMFGFALTAAPLLEPVVTVDCPAPGGWTFSVRTDEVSPGVRVARVKATAERPTPPPTFKAIVSFPQLDAEYVWNPNFGCSENLSPMPWWGSVFTVARTQPLRAWFNAHETNRLTVAVSELRREVKIGGGIKEEDFRIYSSYTFFAEAQEPMTGYETELRLDARAVPFSTAVREAGAWQAQKAGGRPAVPPCAAYDALYSTWYDFHKDVTAEAVEAECAEAARLGMKVVILDDGWQCDDIERSYASCGDWRVSARRFPDMRGHVARVHGLGLKYMVWFSMPFVGEQTEAFARLKGMFLRYNGGIKAWVLDPRFPAVRDYLRDVYLRCLRDWDIDGFKLDFVDQFALEGAVDPAVAEGYRGRDCRSIEAGVEKLLAEVTTALEAVKPGLLFEFRQSYTGPVIRKYGNMMRVADCPGSQLRNRVHMANLRLLCEGSSVHSDMLRWHPDETVVNAQRFVLSAIFGTVQYSVMLRESSPEMKAMIARWIRFADEHRQTLQHGAFRPHFPQLNYPVIEAESDRERIVVRYDPAVPFDLGSVTKPTIVIDAETGDVRSVVPSVRSP